MPIKAVTPIETARSVAFIIKVSGYGSEARDACCYVTLCCHKTLGLKRPRTQIGATPKISRGRHRFCEAPSSPAIAHPIRMLKFQSRPQKRHRARIFAATREIRNFVFGFPAIEEEQRPQQGRSSSE